MSQTRRMLCIFYGLVALIALIATWSQNLSYFRGEHPAGFGQYILDLKASGSARSFTVDIGLYLLAGTGLMVTEARRLGVKWVWAYVILGFAIAISVTFPLFLIARELRLAKTETTSSAVKLGATDFIGLALTTIVVLGMCAYILS
jgi:Terpene cyclase DEP1